MKLKLFEAISYDNYAGRIDKRVFDDIVANDPSNTKKYSQWLINMYLKDIRSYGKLTSPSLKDALLEYHNKKEWKNFPADKKNIMNFESLFEFITFMNSTESLMFANDFLKYIKESIVIYRDSNCIFLYPKTNEASIFFGQKGVEQNSSYPYLWCTANPRQRSHYQSYAEQGDIFIYRTFNEDGTFNKDIAYQLYVPDFETKNPETQDTIQFNDKNNYPQPRDFIENFLNEHMDLKQIKFVSNKLMSALENKPKINPVDLFNDSYNSEDERGLREACDNLTNREIFNLFSDRLSDNFNFLPIDIFNIIFEHLSILQDITSPIYNSLILHRSLSVLKSLKQNYRIIPSNFDAEDISPILFYTDVTDSNLYEIFKFLLSDKEYVNKSAMFSDSYIHATVSRNHIMLLELLLIYYGMTELDFSEMLSVQLSSMKVATFEFLMDYAIGNKITLQKENIRNMYATMVTLGMPFHMHYMINNGVSVPKESGLITKVLWCIEHEKYPMQDGYDLIEILVKNGVNPARDNLNSAIQAGYEDIVSLLKSHFSEGVNKIKLTEWSTIDWKLIKKIASTSPTLDSFIHNAVSRRALDNYNLRHNGGWNGIYKKALSMIKPIKEKQVNDTAIVCFTQANPPTKAHQQLFRKVIATAKNMQGDALIYLSQKYDAQKNPIPWELKVKYIKDYFGKQTYVCNDKAIKTIQDVLQSVYEHQYKKVIIIMGNEKIKETQQILNSNDAEEEPLFTFDSIEVISCGGSDPDMESDDVQYSTANARNAVLDGNKEEFSSIIMGDSDEQISSLWSMIRAGIGISEHVIPHYRYNNND